MGKVHNLSVKQGGLEDGREMVPEAAGEVSAVDEAILQLLKERQQVVSPISETPDAELKRIVERGKALGLDSSRVMRVFRELVGNGNKSGQARVQLASRDYKSEDTVIEVRGVKFGGNNFVVIGGPCAVESYDQIAECAKHLRLSGGHALRGGCFKARTSPYSFQGLGFEGLDYLVQAGSEYNLPIITEVLAHDDVEAVAQKADILQIGARNMQNFILLKAVGRSNRPVMLKRGMSSSIEELLLAAEYVLAQGNQEVILCERGIRTFETSTRNTLDLSAVPVLRSKTHLPIIVDPSHAAGRRDLVPPLAKAAKAVGAQGLMIEFHPSPEDALSDGPQALTFAQFETLLKELQGL